LNPKRLAPFVGKALVAISVEFAAKAPPPKASIHIPQDQVFLGYIELRSHSRLGEGDMAKIAGVRVTQIRSKVRAPMHR